MTDRDAAEALLKMSDAELGNMARGDGAMLIGKALRHVLNEIQKAVSEKPKDG